MDFHSFEHMAHHVRHIQHLSDEVLTAALWLAAEGIKKEVDEMIGTYQVGEGGYASWAPLSGKTMDDRVDRGYPANEPLLVTGALKRSYQVKGGHLWAGVGSNLEKALALEVGNPTHNLPARSLLGIAFVRGEKKAFRRMEVVGAFMLYGKAPLATAVRTL